MRKRHGGPSGSRGSTTNACSNEFYGRVTCLGVLTEEEAARALLNVHHIIKRGVHESDAMAPEDHERHLHKLRAAFGHLAAATHRAKTIEREKLARYSQEKMKQQPVRRTL